MNVQRAYSLFDVKEMDDSRRIFRGVATTPTVDRMGDTIDPLGIQFKNPLPLLHQHDHRSPVGLVKFGQPTENGVEFEAEIPVIEEPGLLKDRVDMAWGEIKHGLVRATSIGFRSLKHAYRDDGGIDFIETEVYELSMVTIPANSQAIISAIKSMSMTNDVMQQIKSLDFSSRKSGSVQLLRAGSKQNNLKGAVRLIRP